jgi:hypothetical protein
MVGGYHTTHSACYGKCNIAYRPEHIANIEQIRYDIRPGVGPGRNPARGVGIMG